MSICICNGTGFVEFPPWYCVQHCPECNGGIGQERTGELIIEALRFFGEPECRFQEVEICANGSAYLGLTQIIEPKVLR